MVLALRVATILAWVHCSAALVVAPVRGTSPHARAAAVRMGRTKMPNDRVTFIDGDNLMMHRKVTKGREDLTAKLAGIRGGRTVIVFDGRKGEVASETGSDPYVVITAGGCEDGSALRQTADEWIERALDEAPETSIEVVTADRNLRRLAHQAKAKTINPSKFWRRYLPRLKGLKNDYLNKPKASAGEK